MRTCPSNRVSQANFAACRTTIRWRQLAWKDRPTFLISWIWSLLFAQRDFLPGDNNQFTCSVHPVHSMSTRKAFLVCSRVAMGRKGGEVAEQFESQVHKHIPRILYLPPRLDLRLPGPACEACFLQPAKVPHWRMWFMTQPERRGETGSELSRKLRAAELTPLGKLLTCCS